MPVPVTATATDTDLSQHQRRTPSAWISSDPAGGVRRPSGRHHDREVPRRGLTAAVGDPGREREGPGCGRCPADPARGGLHGQARREGAGRPRPAVRRHSSSREQAGLVEHSDLAVGQPVGAVGDHERTGRVHGEAERLGGRVPRPVPGSHGERRGLDPRRHTGDPGGPTQSQAVACELQTVRDPAVDQ